MNERQTVVLYFLYKGDQIAVERIKGMREGTEIIEENPYRRRVFEVSTRPGVVVNNTVWFPYSEGDISDTDKIAKTVLETYCHDKVCLYEKFYNAVHNNWNLGSI